MKKICFALLASALLAGCSITQEMKENASFDGLKTFYVAAPAGTNDVFAQTGNAAETDAALKAAVAENLKEKGFVEVSDPKEAQIVFRPLWNATHGRADFDDDNNPDKQHTALSIGTNAASDIYATLEIQAILPDSGDIWSWRGFSPSHVSAADCTTANIKRQVAWCLEYFPPDKYPSRLETIKKEKRETKIREEENPFKEVLIKEREKREAAAK